MTVLQRLDALEAKLDAVLARPTTVHKHEHHHESDYYDDGPDEDTARRDALSLVYIAIEHAWDRAAPPGERFCDWERSQEEPWVSLRDALNDAWAGEKPPKVVPLSLARRRAS